MSQETASANIEIPGPWRYRLAKRNQGSKIERNIELTVDGLNNVPREGAASAIANHRNRKWDVPIIGWALRDVRTPYYPAKKKYGKGLFGIKRQVMKGSGALFFDEDNENERASVILNMSRQLRDGHMLITLPEGTSRFRGQNLGELEPGALEIALRADLDEIVLMGLGGTETSSGFDEDEEIMPTRVHLEIGSLSLAQARDEYTNTPKKERKPLVIDLTQRVIRPALQEVVDIAYERLAT